MSSVRVLIITTATYIPSSDRKNMPLPQQATAELGAFLSRLIATGMSQIAYLELSAEDVEVTFEAIRGVDGILLEISFDQVPVREICDSLEDELMRLVRAWYPARRVAMPNVQVRVGVQS